MLHVLRCVVIRCVVLRCVALRCVSVLHHPSLLKRAPLVADLQRKDAEKQTEELRTKALLLTVRADDLRDLIRRNQTCLEMADDLLPYKIEAGGVRTDEGEEPSSVVSWVSISFCCLRKNFHRQMTGHTHNSAK